MDGPFVEESALSHASIHTGMRVHLGMWARQNYRLGVACPHLTSVMMMRMRRMTAIFLCLARRQVTITPTGFLTMFPARWTSVAVLEAMMVAVMIVIPVAPPGSVMIAVAIAIPVTIWFLLASLITMRDLVKLGSCLLLLSLAAHGHG